MQTSEVEMTLVKIHLQKIMQLLLIWQLYFTT